MSENNRKSVIISKKNYKVVKLFQPHVSVEVFNNTSSPIIKITEDKLRCYLLIYYTKIEKQKDWITPLSVFMSLTFSLVTSEFKNFLSISKVIWNAVFIVFTMITFCWFLYALKSRKNKETVDMLISEIKRG
jgi:hypothetical protein